MDMSRGALGRVSAISFGSALTGLVLLGILYPELTIMAAQGCVGLFASVLMVAAVEAVICEQSRRTFTPTLAGTFGGFAGGTIVAILTPYWVLQLEEVLRYRFGHPAAVHVGIVVMTFVAFAAVTERLFMRLGDPEFATSFREQIAKHVDE
jgi:xanthine/uracil permease